MKPYVSIAIISGVAVAAYAGLRSLPDTECAFLHYQAPEVNADGIQYCGEDETPTFLDLSRLRYPVEMDVSTFGNAAVGEPLEVSLAFITSSGSDIRPHELAISHTEKLHLLVIDPTLSDYHHVHPVPDELSGNWTFTFTPEQAGTYKLFAEFVLARTRQQVVAVGEIEISGSAPRISQHNGLSGQPPTLPIAESLGASPFQFALAIQPQQLTTGSESQFTLTVSRADGTPAELQPVMGAYAHLVAFDESRDGYAHLHPKYTGKEKDAAPQLAFTMSTDKPGKYRLWAQVKLDDEERFYPFDLVVQ